MYFDKLVQSLYFSLAGGFIFGIVFLGVIPHVQTLQSRYFMVHGRFPIIYLLICVGFMISWFVEGTVDTIWRHQEMKGSKFDRKRPVRKKEKEDTNLLILSFTLVTSFFFGLFVIPISSSWESFIEKYGMNDHANSMLLLILESLVGGIFLYIAFMEVIAKQGHNHILHIWIRFFGFLLVVILYLSLGSWTYENKPASILTCHGKTAQQSPIDFGDEVIYNPYLVPSKIHWLNWTVDDFHDVEVPAFRTDSHGWEINFIKKPKSYMTASHMTGIYKPDNIHMHWQFRNDSMARGMGSEHTVNDHHYPAEIHIVFFNEKFGTFEKALGKKNGVAIFGIFVTVGRIANPEYTKIARIIRDARGVGAKLTGKDPRILLMNSPNLLPNTLDYYAYTGSKTTSDYSTCVQWMIFKEPITITHEEYEDLFTLIYNLKNARDPQPVVGPVYSSFLP